MADKTVQLGISADASGVEAGVGKAKQSLKSLGATAQQVGRDASKGLDQVGEGAAKPAQKIDAATRSILNQVQRTSAALAAGGRNTREYYETLANQRGANLEVLKPYLAQLDAVTAAQKRVAASAVDLDKVGTSRGATNFSKSLDGVGTSLGATGFGQTQKDLAGVQQGVQKTSATVAGLNQQLSATGLTAKQTAAALRQVPAQFTDIVTSLAAGQNPLTVLLQQGGQLKDVFGGVGAAAQALGRYVIGLVNPFTVLAAAAATVAYGFIAGSREAQEFNKTLILTGNQIGLTVGQLTQMAARLDDLGGTQARAAEVLGAFAGSSRIAAESVERYAAAAIALERVGGPAAEETAKAFVELGKAPLQAALKLNEATGFLTRSVYEQVKALEAQGRTTEAARVAQDAYANAISTRAPQIAQQLGLVERAWKGIKDAAAEALDGIKSIGRVEGLEGQIAGLEAAAARLRAASKNQAVAGFRETLRAAGGVSFSQQAAEVEKVIARLRESLDLERGIASLNAKAQESTRAKIEFDKQGEEFLSKQAKAAREIAQAKELGVKAGLKQEEIDKRVQAIRDKFAEKPKGGKTAEFSGLQVDLSAIERDFRTLTGAYANAEAILAAQRQAGLVSEADYYEARRAFIRINADAQVEALQAESALIQASINSGKLKADERAREAEKIKDNLAKIQEAEAKAAAQTAILGIQQTSAINSVSRAYKEAQQAAQDYLDTLQRSQRRDLELMSLGDGARQRAEGRQRIEDQYAQERRRIENERNLLSLQQGGNLTSDQQKRFDDLLAINQDFQAKAMASYEDYTRQRLALEMDWSVGASRAVAQYLEEAQNVARQTEDFFANAFRGMEDALVDFIRTGKLDFKSLADSIVADIARIIVKQQLSKAIGLVGEAGASSSSSGDGWVAAAAQFVGALFGGGRAIGGPVSAGQMYRVNERRPELLNVAGEQYLMMGSQGGQVKEAPRSAQAPQVITVNVAMPQGGSRQTAQQFGVEVGRQLQLATARGA